MSLVSLAAAASQLRMVSPADDNTDELQRLIDAAESVCIEYLDRYVFVDQPAMIAAQTAMPSTFQAAYDAWTAAYTAQNVTPPTGYPNHARSPFDRLREAGSDAYGEFSGADWNNSVVLDPVQRMVLRAANEMYRAAFRDAERTFQAGYYSVTNTATPPVTTATPLGAAFTHAVLLMVSNYDVNREAVNVETSSAIVMPFGTQDLLFPYRRNIGAGR